MDATIQTDERGVEYVEHANLEQLPKGWALCGTCHRAWNDEKSTSVTPTPSGRCPFEYEHDAEDDDAVEIGFGYVLKNGATVIAASSRRAHEWVVLAAHTDNDGSVVEYVTWKCSRPGNGNDTQHGHYFDDLREAVEDFYSRP